MPESKSGALPLGDIPVLWGERWDSNPRRPVPQTGALPTELRSPYGACLEIRTPGPRLRRALLYPAELNTQNENLNLRYSYLNFLSFAEFPIQIKWSG